jgi:hypothetical protein
MSQSLCADHHRVDTFHELIQIAGHHFEGCLTLDNS